MLDKVRVSFVRFERITIDPAVASGKPKTPFRLFLCPSSVSRSMELALLATLEGGAGFLNSGLRNLIVRSSQIQRARASPEVPEPHKLERLSLINKRSVWNG